MEIMIIKCALAIIFALAILGKLTGKTKSTFEKAGYGPSMMYATAVAEAIFTIGLFTSYELFATIGLLAVIGGAIFTLFRQGASPKHYILAIVAVILLATLLCLQIFKLKLIQSGALYRQIHNHNARLILVPFL